MIRALCRELGVRTEPAKLGGVWIAPIYSWYHASFDREPDVPGAPAVEKVCRRGPLLLAPGVACIAGCRVPARLPASAVRTALPAHA